MVLGQGLHGVHLLLYRRRGAMKLHEQHRIFAQRELGVLVHHADGIGIEQLAAGNRNTELNNFYGGVDCIGECCKRAGCRHHRFGQRIEFDRDLRHHAQGAFAAHHQAR